MVALNFSARSVAPNATLEPLPSGVYDVIITGSQEKPTKDTQGSYIEFEMTVRSPDASLNGRKLFDRLNIRNRSQQAVDIAYATLSAICHVTGRYDIADTAQLHGIPFKAVVAKVARDDRPGEFSNDVKGYKDAQGNDPGNPGAPQAGPAPGPQGGQPGYGGAPQGGAPQQGYSGGQGNAAVNGQQYQPNPQPGPGQAQQTSDQHYAAGPQGGAPQGGAPQGGAPAWAGGGAPQGGAPQPQGGQPYQQQPQPSAPQGGQPQGGQPGFAPQPDAPPPWAQPQA